MMQVIQLGQVIQRRRRRVWRWRRVQLGPRRHQHVQRPPAELRAVVLLPVTLQRLRVSSEPCFTKYTAPADVYHFCWLIAAKLR